MLSFDKFYSQISKTILKGRKFRSIKILLEILYEQNRHLSINEIANLYEQKSTKTISKTSIYNAINLLEKYAIISSCLENESKKFEINLSKHHDHIICIKCDKIIEFFDNELEILQDEICLKNEFILINHKVVLGGICRKCYETLSKKDDINTQKTLSVN